MNTNGVQPSKLRWFLTVVAITLGVYLGFKYLLALIFPFMVAYFLAWIIRPVTESLFHYYKIPRIFGGTFSLLLLVGVFGTVLFLLIKILIKQAIAFLKNIPIYLELIASKLDSICSHCDNLMGYDDGTVRAIVDENLTNNYNKIKSNIMPTVTEHTISITADFAAFLGVFIIVLIAAVLIVNDLPDFHKRMENNNYYKDIHKVTSKLSEAGMAYLRCQLIIMIIVAGICTLALILIKNDYAVLIATGIAFMDALPLLGISLVMVPWIIVMLVNGNIYAAAILTTAYLICQLVRDVLEPKLIGSRIGIKPLYTMVAMYVGIKLFGLAGFFLGPIGLVIITTIYQTIYERE